MDSPVLDAETFDDMFSDAMDEAVCDSSTSSKTLGQQYVVLYFDPSPGIAEEYPFICTNITKCVQKGKKIDSLANFTALVGPHVSTSPFAKQCPLWKSVQEGYENAGADGQKSFEQGFVDGFNGQVSEFHLEQKLREHARLLADCVRSKSDRVLDDAEFQSLTNMFVDYLKQCEKVVEAAATFTGNDGLQITCDVRGDFEELRKRVLPAAKKQRGKKRSR